MFPRALTPPLIGNQARKPFLHSSARIDVALRDAPTRTHSARRNSLSRSQSRERLILALFHSRNMRRRGSGFMTDLFAVSGKPYRSFCLPFLKLSRRFGNDGSDQSISQFFQRFDPKE